MNKEKKMYVVAVDMGYGHQRAAFPLLNVAEGGIITANNYPGITAKEVRMWARTQKPYELISYLKAFPIFGEALFSIMDYVQRIEPFYPKRDLSASCAQQKFLMRQVRAGLGKNLIERLNKKPLPLVATFFAAAYFAEYYNYKEEIYCVVCDSDIARAWAPYRPSVSRINYLVPNKRVKERLQLYGVRGDKIFITGFPLPETLIGGENYAHVKADLQKRLVNLDPRGIYRKKFKSTIDQFLPDAMHAKKADRPLTITFAVGGAGAQRHLGGIIINRLKTHLQEGDLKLNLVAGSRGDVYEFFQRTIRAAGLMTFPSVEVIYAENKNDYFSKYNDVLRNTDILWTKPSEMIFYSALGLPIIMSDPVGSQEHYNRAWLMTIGAGIDQEDPNYVDEWLFDWLDSGWLAQAALNGYMNAAKGGTYHIKQIVLHNKVSEIDSIHLL